MSRCIDDYIAILNAKGVDFRCILWGISRDEVIRVIREGAFGRTYFRDIYSGVTGKWYKKSWKELDQLRILIGSIIAQIIMMSVLINMVLNAEHC